MNMPLCCSSTRYWHGFKRRHYGLVRHFKTDPTETVALCFEYPKTPCLRADGSCLPEQTNRPHMIFRIKKVSQLENLPESVEATSSSLQTLRCKTHEQNWNNKPLWGSGGEIALTTYNWPAMKSKKQTVNETPIKYSTPTFKWARLRWCSHALTTQSFLTQDPIKIASNFGTIEWCNFSLFFRSRHDTIIIGAFLSSLPGSNSSSTRLDP
jgi:hypothetical protein